MVAVGEAAIRQLEQIADAMTASIRASVATYGPGGLVPRAELRRSCRAHARFVLSAMRGRPEQRALGVTTGRSGAEQGLPLPDVMSSYRLGLAEIWRAVAAAAVEESMPPTAVVEITAEVWRQHENFVSDVITSYREVVAQRMLTEEEEASALVESLLEGRLGELHTLAETARLLRLPTEGPYVVVFAEVLQPGKHALPGVRERLAAADLPSAWRLLPDGQVGIVRVESSRVGRLMELLRAAASHRIGVSPAFSKLTETVEAVPLARLAMQSCAGGVTVQRFEDDLIGVAAVAAPQVTGRFTTSVLGGLGDLPVAERTMLLDTLRAWLGCGGSANVTAEKLFVHPNTVRHRLRRIEQRTGRAISDPRAVTELCLAAEAEVRLRAL